ncbi:putative RAB-interacting protein [Trypanosoma rangeli]|uniref:PRA1 family protein n=1 Tax=Trypanosoma rangeli TaxID=5698 RepID=A0A422NG43_TRYRA|nr:putative RAB-interacting protein [Trypanosoma rangeli]RNF04445.1 putative RAB-interacting protein [Trypanosoma rangeli]|eukprot:RNF04445.1 putative RAB-interacting protein [Trypanosoma rangeli]
MEKDQTSGDAGTTGALHLNDTNSSSELHSFSLSATSSYTAGELLPEIQTTTSPTTEEQQQYQHPMNVSGALSILRDVVQQVWKVIKELHKEELPWLKDFFDREQFIPPNDFGDVVSRLNLNLPFYAANYVVICYTVVLPFLLLYDPLFFAILCVFTVTVHSIYLVERKRPKCGSKMYIGGFSVLYRRLADIFLVVLLLLFLFWDGLRTLGLVLLINSVLVLPHAVLRRPTYFDDEELEKLRPKMVQYIIILVLLLLAYLEGKESDGGRGDRCHEYNYHHSHKNEKEVEGREAKEKQE